MTDPTSAQDTTTTPEYPTEQVSVWGPDNEKKPRRPVGMGDVVLGLVGYIGFSLVASIIVIAAVVGSASSTDQASIEEISAQVTSGAGVVFVLLLSWAGLLLPTWWAATRKGDGDWRKLLNWGFRAKIDIPLAIGVTAVILGFQVLLNLGASAVGIDPESLSNTSVVTSQTGIWLVAMALCAGIGAPIVEEIFFRGLFLTVATRNYGRVAGIVLSSAVFGVLHMQGTLLASIFVVTQTAVLGAIMAIMVTKTKRLGTPIAFHMVFNSTGVAIALLTLN